jgi:ligand-binding sensor domain-containing protein
MKPGIVIFLLSIVVFSQKTSAQELFFSRYTVSDGLVNNSIRKIYQDSKGFLWISTWEGLSKYDGHRFTNFTERNGLSHNLVNDVTETPDGEIYVAMNNGSVDIIRSERVEQNEIFKNTIINKFEPTANGDLIALTDNRGIISINKKNITPFSQTGNTSFYNLIRLNDSLMVAAADPLPVFIFTRQYHVWAVSQSRLKLFLLITITTR